MVGSINKVILVGNLGADPKVANTASGTKVVNLNIATSDSWKDKLSGERKERTEWHRVVIFNPQLADVAEASCKPANGKIITVRKDTPPRLFCKTSPAIWFCLTAAVTAFPPAAMMSSPVRPPMPAGTALPLRHRLPIWMTISRSKGLYLKKEVPAEPLFLGLCLFGPQLDIKLQIVAF